MGIRRLVALYRYMPMMAGPEAGV